VRNPIRLKNLRWRFWPFYLGGAVALLYMEPTRAGFGAGVGLVLAGAALRTWSAGHLVKNDRLTLTGPYAHLRHPLYAGTLLIATGFTVMVGGWPAPVLWALVMAWFFLHYFPRKERVEARRLEARYGDAYRHYRARVPALLPRLRPYRAPGDGEARGWSGALYDGNNELGTALALAIGVGALALRTFALR